MLAEVRCGRCRRSCASPGTLRRLISLGFSYFKSFKLISLTFSFQKLKITFLASPILIPPVTTAVVAAVVVVVVLVAVSATLPLLVPVVLPAAFRMAFPSLSTLPVLLPPLLLSPRGIPAGCFWHFDQCGVGRTAHFTGRPVLP